MNNNDNFRNNDMDVSTMDPLDGDEVRKSGAEREDASGWDRLSDTQRKLIAFGVLLGIVVFLVLMLAMGSSCGACADCAAKNNAASSDTEDKSDRQPGFYNDPLPEYPDYPGVSVYPEYPDSSEYPDAPEYPGSPEHPDYSNTPEYPDYSGTSGYPTYPDFTVSEGDVSPSDTYNNGTEYVEVVRPGGLSACSHQADNEAGGGSESVSGGFLGFLFGCQGCSEGCTIDVNSSLTDPGYDDEDSTRQDGMTIPGSESYGHYWEVQPDDEAYLELLRTQLTVISEDFASLNSLDSVLAAYSDPQRVRENDRFRKLTEGMLQWCDAAEHYDASMLTGDKAFVCNMNSVRLAGDLRRYIEEYPLLVTGATSGSDVLERTTTSTPSSGIS